MKLIEGAYISNGVRPIETGALERVIEEDRKRKKEQRTAELLAKAQEEAKRYAEEAEKAQEKVDFWKGIGESVVRPFISVAEIPKLIATKGEKGFGKVNVPGLGETQSYQEEFRKTQDEIIKGEKPLYTALAPIGKAVLDTASLGLGSKLTTETAKTATKGFTKKLIQQIFSKNTAKIMGEGGIYGLGYGGVSIAENPDMTAGERVKTLGTSTLAGALTAGAFKGSLDVVGVGLNSILRKTTGKRKTEANIDDILDTKNKIEKEVGEKVSVENESVIAEAMSNGAKKEDIIAEVSKAKNEVDGIIKEEEAIQQAKNSVYQSIANTNNEKDIKELLEAIVNEKDAKILSVALKDTKNPAVVASVIEKRLPETKVNKAVAELSVAETPAQKKTAIKNIVKGEESEIAIDVLDSIPDEQAKKDFLLNLEKQYREEIATEAKPIEAKKPKAEKITQEMNVGENMQKSETTKQNLLQKTKKYNNTEKFVKAQNFNRNTVESNIAFWEDQAKQQIKKIESSDVLVKKSETTGKWIYKIDSTSDNWLSSPFSTKEKAIEYAKRQKQEALIALKNGDWVKRNTQGIESEFKTKPQPKNIQKKAHKIKKQKKISENPPKETSKQKSFVEQTRSKLIQETKAKESASARKDALKLEMEAENLPEMG